MKRYYAKRIKCTDPNMGPFKWVVIDRETDLPVAHFHEFPMHIHPVHREIMTTQEMAQDSANHKNEMHEGHIKEQKERATKIKHLRKVLDSLAFTDQELATAFTDIVGWDELLKVALILVDNKARRVPEVSEMNRFAGIGHKIHRFITNIS